MKQLEFVPSIHILLIPLRQRLQELPTLMSTPRQQPMARIKIRLLIQQRAIVTNTKIHIRRNLIHVFCLLFEHGAEFHFEVGKARPPHADFAESEEVVEGVRDGVVETVRDRVVVEVV